MSDASGSDQVQLHIFVSGRVQGVGFRFHALKEAQALRLKGWVKNLEDGRVEILIQGRERHVQKFMKWCQKGPPAAKVENLEIEKSKVTQACAEFTVA